jgi:HSP20 family molecular chaperone IbpA
MLTPRFNLFDDLFDDFGLEREMRNLDRKLYGRKAGREMLTDVKEHDDHYDLEIELPGFKKEDLTVELNDGYLTITAEKSHDQNKEKDGKLVRQERYAGVMSRSYYVGEDLKTEDIHGKYEGGVLTLSIPKREEQKKVESPNRILIEG